MPGSEYWLQKLCPFGRGTKKQILIFIFIHNQNFSIMKRFIALLICMIAMMVVMPPGQVKAAPDTGVCYVLSGNDIAPAMFAQEAGGVTAEVTQESVENVSAVNFVKNNWIALVLGLLGFIELIVRLTPTERDNSLFNWLTALINGLLPNFKKGGGTFKVLSK